MKILFLLNIIVAFSCSQKKQKLSAEQSSNSIEQHNVFSKIEQDTFSNLGRRFKLELLPDSSHAKLSYYDNDQWKVNIDSVYLANFASTFPDLNYDGHNDIFAYYNRFFHVNLFNPSTKLFEKEPIGFSNAVQTLDTINKLYFDDAFDISWNGIYSLFQIKNYTQKYLYYLETEEEPNANGLYQHKLYKCNANIIDAKVIGSFKDKHDHMSIDYKKYWQKVIKQYGLPAE